MVTLTPADYKRIAWVKSFKAGEKWLLKLEKQYGEKLETFKNYALALEAFCEYVGMNPDEIIEAYKAALDKNVREAVDEWNEKLDLFVPWLIKRGKKIIRKGKEEIKPIKRSTASTKFCAIKSFFDYNVSIALTAKTPEFHSEAKKPVTLDDLREKVLPHADVYQTFEILFLKDSGVSQDEALRFNVRDVQDMGNGFGYLKVFREKEGVDYETWIGSNAMQAMKRTLDYRRQLGLEVTKDSPLFVKKNKPNERQEWRLISSSLSRLGEKAGVELSTHRLRKTFETFLAIAKVHPIILKYWMGHKVKKGKSDVEMRYIIPPTPEQMKLYMEAYKYLDMAPRPDETKVEMLAKKEALRILAKNAGYSDAEISHIIRQQKDVPEVEVLERLASKPKKVKTETNGGGDCGETFEQIRESQLLTYLKAGWQIVHRLESGEVIVRR